MRVLLDDIHCFRKGNLKPLRRLRLQLEERRLIPQTYPKSPRHLYNRAFGIHVFSDANRMCVSPMVDVGSRQPARTSPSLHSQSAILQITITKIVSEPTAMPSAKRTRPVGYQRPFVCLVFNCANSVLCCVTSKMAQGS